MPTRSVKDLVAEMVRDVLGPPMKDAGFRRTGRTFYRNDAKVCHVIAISMSRWGTRSSGSIDIDLGVFWHEVEARRRDSPLTKMPPLVRQCTFHIALFHAMPKDVRSSYDVTLSSDFSAMGKLILTDLREVGLHWLEYRSDLSRSLEMDRYSTDLGDGKSSTPEWVAHGILGVIFKGMLGRKKEALAELKEYSPEGFEARTARIRQWLKT